jgi:hypothetical protein
MADAADLARALLDLHRARTTAVLTVQGPGVRTLVYFREGAAVWAGEGPVDRTLGRMLLRDGVLDPDQYGSVIERMSTAAAAGKGLRFGEVAVEMGYLDRAQVAEALREQVRRRIMDCLACEDADIEIRESAEEVAAVPQHVLSIAALVTAGIRLHWDDARTGPLVAALADERPMLRGEAITLAERLGLGLADMSLLASMDGVRTTRALVDGSPLGVDPAARLFAALVLLDAVTFPWTKHGAVVGRPSVLPPPPPARPAAPARPVASRPAASPASPRASPAPKPPAGTPAVTEAPAPPPASVFEAAAPVPVSQLPLDLRRVRLEAEQQFQTGRFQLLAGKTFPAARILRRAATLYPDAAEYALWADWAEYKTLREIAEQAAKRVSLKEAAIAAIRQDKQLAMGHYVLGLTLAMEGDRKTALRFLRRAVELEPANREFTQELQAVSGPVKA